MNEYLTKKTNDNSQICHYKSHKFFKDITCISIWPKDDLSLRQYNKAAETFIVLTEIVGGYGDLQAAKKLIIALKKNYPDLKIQWIICNPSNATLPKNLETIPDDLLLIDTWQLNSSLLNPALLSKGWFAHAAMILCYPLGIPFSQQGFLELENILPKRTQIFCCSEYDPPFPPLSQVEEKTLDAQQNPTVFFTGFNKNALGVFIETFTPRTTSEIIYKLRHPSLLQLLDNTRPEQYQNDHVFFFAYFNSKVSRVQNRVNAMNYCAIISAYTNLAKIPQRHLDILCPFTDRELEEFKPKWLFRRNVNKIIIDKNGKKIIYDHPQPLADGRIVSILADTTISDHSEYLLVKQLAYYSALATNITPFLGCTGDQSLSEILSLPSSATMPAPLIFYQVMDWKKRLSQELLAICPQNSSYTNIFSYLMLMLKNDPFRVPSLEEFGIELMMNGLESAEKLANIGSGSIKEVLEKQQQDHENKAWDNHQFIETITRLLLDPSIAQEMSAICANLRKTRNLYEHLPKKIENIIRENYPKLLLGNEPLRGVVQACETHSCAC